MKHDETRRRQMDARDWLRRGREHRQKAAWEQALAAYQQALALDPHNVAAHNDLGGIYEQLDDAQQAEAHYRAALQIEPDSAPMRYNLGLFYKAQARAPEAQAELEHFLQLVDDRREIQEACALLKELSELDFAKCAGCGSVTTLGKFYQSVNKKTLCPRCFPASRGKHTWLVVGLCALSLITLNVLCNSGTQILYYHALNLVLFMAFIYLAIIPHELGHAGVSWLLGSQVLEIRLGLGPVVWQTTLRGLLISVTRYPLVGLCVQVFATRKFIRLRRFIAVAAGPLSNALLVLLFAPGFQFSHLGQTYALRETFVGANALTLFVCLWPRVTYLASTQVPSDGQQLWQTITEKHTSDVIHLAYYAFTSAYAMRAGDHARVVQICQEGLALYPRSTLLKNTQASALLEMGRPAEALELFESLWESFEKESWDTEITEQNRPIVQAMLSNNIACATILVEPKPDALQQAFDHARQAFKTMPWLGSIQSTWGAVLIETGQVHKGIQHLSEAQVHIELSQHQASNLAYMAWGYHCLGDTDKAAETLDKALALDAQGFVVQKIRAALQEEKEC